METFLTEVAKQVPSLGVLCFIVWIFIKHLSARDETLKEMHQEHLYAREQNRVAIKDNTQAMLSSNDLIGSLKYSVDDLKDVIKNKLTHNGR